MSIQHSTHGKISKTIPLVTALILVLLIALTYVGVRSRDRIPFLQDFTGNVSKKLEILSNMRAHLFDSEQAEKSAVMADTDEASRQFADRSRLAADLVDKGRQEFQSLLQRDHTSKEMELFNEFDTCWTELRKVDQIILGFAVQNTNLKASALSLGKGREDMNQFEQAMESLIHSDTPSDNHNRIVLLASDALVAGLNIFNLHAPHIAESSDEKMDQLETEMRHNGEIVDTSLRELSDLVPDEDRKSLDEAKAAFGKFTEVATEVIRLSRQNTNVKSLELSLGRKRKIAAQCDEILTGLQEAVGSKDFKATR